MPLTDASDVAVGARQIRHLDFISQFTSDIRFLKGSSNAAADALSRVEVDALGAPLSSTSSVDVVAMARAQQDDPDLLNSVLFRYRHQIPPYSAI